MKKTMFVTSLLLVVGAGWAAPAQAATGVIQMGMAVLQPPTVYVGKNVNINVKTYAGVRCKVNNGTLVTNPRSGWLAFPRSFPTAGVHKVTVWCTAGTITGSIVKYVTVKRQYVPPTPTSVYYANCDAVRAAGAAPLYSWESGYRAALDRDSDGVACEV